MINNIIIIAVLVVAVVAGVFVVFPKKINSPVESSKPTPLVSDAVECKSEQRNAEICNTQYAPVCAAEAIECVMTPCDPIPRTYSNSCEACANPLVRSYTQGACK